MANIFHQKKDKRSLKYTSEGIKEDEDKRNKKHTKPLYNVNGKIDVSIFINIKKKLEEEHHNKLNVIVNEKINIINDNTLDSRYTMTAVIDLCHYNNNKKKIINNYNTIQEHNYYQQNNINEEDKLLTFNNLLNELQLLDYEEKVLSKILVCQNEQ